MQFLKPAAPVTLIPLDAEPSHGAGNDEYDFVFEDVEEIMLEESQASESVIDDETLAFNRDTKPHTRQIRSNFIFEVEEEEEEDDQFGDFDEVEEIDQIEEIEMIEEISSHPSSSENRYSDDFEGDLMHISELNRVNISFDKSNFRTLVRETDVQRFLLRLFEGRCDFNGFRECLLHLDEKIHCKYLDGKSRAAFDAIEPCTQALHLLNTKLSFHCPHPPALTVHPTNEENGWCALHVCGCSENLPMPFDLADSGIVELLKKREVLDAMVCVRRAVGERMHSAVGSFSHQLEGERDEKFEFLAAAGWEIVGLLCNVVAIDALLRRDYPLAHQVLMLFTGSSEGKQDSTWTYMPPPKSSQLFIIANVTLGQVFSAIGVPTKSINQLAAASLSASYSSEICQSLTLAISSRRCFDRENFDEALEANGRAYQLLHGGNLAVGNLESVWICAADALRSLERALLIYNSACVQHKIGDGELAMHCLKRLSTIPIVTSRHPLAVFFRSSKRIRFVPRRKEAQPMGLVLTRETDLGAAHHQLKELKDFLRNASPTKSPPKRATKVVHALSNGIPMISMLTPKELEQTPVVKTPPVTPERKSRQMLDAGVMSRAAYADSTRHRWTPKKSKADLIPKTPLRRPFTVTVTPGTIRDHLARGTLPRDRHRECLLSSLDPPVLPTVARPPKSDLDEEDLHILSMLRRR